MQILSSLKKIDISLTQFNLLIACWLAAGLNISFFKKVSELGSYTGALSYLFVFATFVLLAGFYFFVLQLINWKHTAKVLSAVLIFLGGGAAYFVNQLGAEINRTQMENVAQTDLHETLDLITAAPFVLWFIGMVILPLIILFFLKIKPATFKRTIFTKLITLVLALVCMSGVLFSFYGEYAPIFREHRELKSKITPLNVLSGGLSYIKTQFHHNKKQQPLVRYGEDAHMVVNAASKQPKILVVVVGETARAQNFSLNGYPKLTNPELSKLDIINFSNASSCGTQTSVSVPCMFSGMPRHDYDEGLAAHREGLLDIVQRAGYKVTWIDNNSGCKGACDRIQTYISPKDDARYKQWCEDGECKDQVLLEALRDYLKTLDLKQLKQNQLIVLHQVGSHGPAYYKRYPEEFKKFTPTCDTNNIQNCDHNSLINTYDNTIVYTDHILATLIQDLKQLPIATGMMYMSDHGESTGESGMYLHGAPYMMAPKEQTHIPMIFWFSQQWPQQTALRSCLSQQQKSAVSQDNLFPTVLGLLDIQTQVLNPKLNMVQNCQGQN
ncbi:phosphoethanolamine--lipid A transferase [Acinetobacter sp. MD2(2019)]|uniref:phosphoethanolamine transferase n=1 Tax=Acinetobacter sp. MD2(2019) TaxID=2605273 RepID=UPI002D1ED638|nr:phosphoethanolamine--lipid A transferase [Acinetobacter sp. MD2(2019)]MEB3754874.1 phosphoethanolamine--lipid A transferase [Acinetobacter sp. MD2(2019)]